EDAGEVVHPMSFIRSAEPAGDRQIAGRVPHDLAQPAALRRRRPVEAEARRDVVPVGPVRFYALAEVLVRRRGAGPPARLGQITGGGGRIAEVAARLVT